MKNKRALITGITGQDGTYLARLLLTKGYQVYGSYRRTSILNLDRIECIGIKEQIKLIPMDLLDTGNIIRVIETIKPQEIYNLAAQSFVAVSFEQPLSTADVTGLGAARILEAIRIVDPSIKYYQASTSEMFGNVQSTPQNENTPFYPRSPYAAAKLYAHWMTVNYRESYDIFSCCGILFNHESPLRGHEFVTRKISIAAARIKQGLQKELHLGNLDAKRDWGYAPEYVEAMWLMLQQEKPNDYVIGTGETHSVGEFVKEAFSYVGLNWENYVVIDPTFCRPCEVELLIGDPRKAEKELGWKARTKFNELVHIMMAADLERLPIVPEKVGAK